MSSIAVTASATGAGVITLAAPITATNRTITLPDATGTLLSTATPGVPIGGPAFSAYPSGAQAISAAVWTKVLFQIEEFDTNSNYNTTLSRFTPTVAGYYQFTSVVEPQASLAYMYLGFYKNGSDFKRNSTPSPNGTSVAALALIFLNGSTDYVEVYLNFSSSINTNTSSNVTYFQAALVRSAT